MMQSEPTKSSPMEICSKCWRAMFTAECIHPQRLQE